MDTDLLVEDQIDAGQKLIDQLVRDGFPVAVAFWARAAGEGASRLYIASPLVTAEKPGDAYRKVFASLRNLPVSWVELSDIKLIPALGPVAREAVSVRDRYPGKSPTRYHGKCLGPLLIEEAYIYPPPGKWFKGFDEIKERFPSAEVFTIPVLFDAARPAELGAYMGQINAGTFEGRAPGTVLFVGPAGSSAARIGELVFVHRPEGWNTFYSPKTERWEEVLFAATGEPPYRSVDFVPLAALKTDRKPHEEKIERMKKLLEQGGSITIPPDLTPIRSIPFTPPPEPGGQPRPLIDWEEIRTILDLGGTIHEHGPPKKDIA